MKAKELIKGKTYETDNGFDVVNVEDVLELCDIAFLEGQIHADPSVERCSIRKAKLKKIVDQITL